MVVNLKQNKHKNKNKNPKLKENKGMQGQCEK